MLGPQGRAAADADRQRIIAEGGRPLIVTLVSGCNVAITTVVCEDDRMRTLH
jgi:hypothetical protein